MTSTRSYTRPDGTVMVEIAPGQFVNRSAAQTLGLKPLAMPGTARTAPPRAPL